MSKLKMKIADISGSRIPKFRGTRRGGEIVPQASGSQYFIGTQQNGQVSVEAAEQDSSEDEIFVEALTEVSQVIIPLLIGDY